MQARLARRLERPARPNRLTILLTASILACVPGSAPAEAQPWTAAFCKNVGAGVRLARVRPGIRDRLALKASMAAGIIFNHASSGRALLDRISGPVSLDVRNSFGARPTVGVEYPLARKLEPRGSVNCTAARPSFVAENPQGERRGTWNASNVSVQTAVVVNPLRQPGGLPISNTGTSCTRCMPLKATSQPQRAF